MTLRFHVEMYDAGSLAHIEPVRKGDSPAEIIARDRESLRHTVALAEQQAADTYRRAALDADNPQDDADLRDTEAADDVITHFRSLLNRTYITKRCQSRTCMCRFATP